MTAGDALPPSLLPEEDDPDRRALKLASLCDLVIGGGASSVSATFPRATDLDDITTLAERITAGRGLVADVEVGPEAITVHIRKPHDGDVAHG
jgi:hypothetical protein